ncbi:MAG: hypothetical protein MZV70_46695 [Desulfobacterales bacterium]|nr:hypothetical protein [Desulfobacterales bacterium]
MMMREDGDERARQVREIWHFSRDGEGREGVLGAGRHPAGRGADQPAPPTVSTQVGFDHAGALPGFLHGRKMAAAGECGQRAGWNQAFQPPCSPFHEHLR